LKTIAVTAGYINPAPRREFFSVLDTLKWLAAEGSTWLEITNLVIPGANDDPGDIRRMCEWIVAELGPQVPLHFSAFFPAFRMQDTPPTEHDTLIKARDIAIQAGLHYVYVGNVFDRERESTYCPGCKRLLIERDWYALGEYHLRGSACEYCGQRIAGHFGQAPGNWGRRRQSVDPAQLLRQLDFAGESGEGSTRGRQ
jgi:pyruvate formate lyase activating enzyme